MFLLKKKKFRPLCHLDHSLKEKSYISVERKTASVLKLLKKHYIKKSLFTRLVSDRGFRLATS